MRILQWLTSRWPVVHWPSVRGRASVDAGPLLLVAGVVGAVALLAGATPPLMRSTSDAATREAVRRAADDAAVRVEWEWGDDYGATGGRVRNPQLADTVADRTALASHELDPGLRSALRPPVTTVSSPALAITDGSVLRRLQLEYLHSGVDSPAVTWVAGRAPGPAIADEFREVPLNGPPWQVQIGLSEAEAKTLGVRPGDQIPVQDERRTPYDVSVAGLFRPVDPDDPAWQLVPWILQPATSRDGLGSKRFGGLLTAESLPDARLAFRADQLQPTIRFDAKPDRLTFAAVQALAAEVATLKGSSAVSADRHSSLKWATQLDSVLLTLRGQIATATAQASVLLIAVLSAALLVVALAFDLLTRRRAGALATARQHGASLPAVAVELFLEASAVTVPAAALGLLLSVAVTGSATLTWVLPFLAVAVCAGPISGIREAAQATRDRRAPANRSARRWLLRTGLLRLAARDAAVVLLAAGSLVALRQRGITANLLAGSGSLEAGPSAGGDAILPAAAPTLVALAASLLVVRLLPWTTSAALRLSLRSRRPLTLFAAARASATSARALPAIAMISSIALASFALTLHATTQRGLAEGAWQTVGADARLDLSPESAGSAAEIARQVAAAPGVRHAVAAQVVDNARFVVNDNTVTARFIVVDLVSFRDLLSDTPQPGLPPAPLGANGTGPTPALVRTADGSLRPGTDFRFPLVSNIAISLAAVGSAPAVGASNDVVMVDPTAAVAAGWTFEPTTIWATGPGAAAAIRRTAVDGQLTARTDVLKERRTAPLTAGLVGSWLTAAAVLFALGMLGFALASAASAPERWVTLARLRTLGLRQRDGRRVAAGELLPALLVAAVLGPATGALLAWLTLRPLALRLLTAQAGEPVTVIPWWIVDPVTLGALTTVLAAVVAVESVVRRRRRLGDVLRAGG